VSTPAGRAYSLALALMLTHEIDAAFRAEWRILPGLNMLADEIGRDIFIAAHVPLVYVLVVLGWHGDAKLRDRTRMAFAAFCVVHVALHVLFWNAPGNTFNNALSQTLIWGCGAAGVAYLWLARRVANAA
jgi:hypothetical protein